MGQGDSNSMSHDDTTIKNGHFSKDLRLLAEQWMSCSVDDLDIEIVEEPISKFEQQIKQMQEQCDELPEHADRTKKIKELLEQGEKLFPIYVKKNDPDLWVMEGRHRMLATSLMGIKMIPVGYVSVSKSNDVAVYEEVTKELTTTEGKNIPLSMVFGHGTVGNIESFGGKSLLQNTQAVDAAFDNTKELQNIWNHSHSQWVWGHINLHWKSPLHNMRQIAAEINSKKNALNSAKWSQVRNEIKIKKIQEQLQKGNEEGTLDYWKEIELKIKLAELQEGMVDSISFIEGGMKDVLALNNLYEQVKKQVNTFSEADVEKEESKTHLRRSLTQCIRDVRQTGSISKGEQEYMEQIGVNPMKIQKAIRVYVASEENDDNWDISGLNRFVNSMVDELIDYYQVDKKVMEMKGLSSEVVEDYININKIALPKTSNEDD